MSPANGSVVSQVGDGTSQEISQSASSMLSTFVDALPRLGAAVVLVAAGWLVSRVLRLGLQRAFLRRRTPSFSQVMSKVIGWAVLTVTVLLAVAVTFPSVRPVNLLAGLGFFSLAVGFAFQDILENTLAGMLLLFRQPFRAGDQIEVVDQSGTVTEINIRETRLTTYDGESLIIPNRDVYKNVIRVHTNFEVHRLEFDVGIAYENDVRQATVAIVQALRCVDGVAADPAPVAFAHELGVSTVVIRALFWTTSQRAGSIVALDAAIVAVKARLDRDGIEFPANVVVLQAAPSFQAAIHGDAGVTPAGGMHRPNSGAPARRETTTVAAPDDTL